MIEWPVTLVTCCSSSVIVVNLTFECLRQNGRDLNAKNLYVGCKIEYLKFNSNLVSRADNRDNQIQVHVSIHFSSVYNST